MTPKVTDVIQKIQGFWDWLQFLQKYLK